VLAPPSRWSVYESEDGDEVRNPLRERSRLVQAR